KDTIQGFSCQKITYNIFSNTYEVWYTQQVTVNGSPSISLVPSKGLVLKYVINGNREVRAKNIRATHEQIELPSINYYKVNDAEYAAQQIKSRYTVIPILNHHQINYENLPSHMIKHMELVEHYSKGNILLSHVKLPNQPSKGSYFLKLTDWSNGDAYDRVGSVFLMMNDKPKSFVNALIQNIDSVPFYTDKNSAKYQGIMATKTYSPAVELMRFFTPFGVGHFNKKRIIAGYNWSDSVIYKQDVTALIPTDAEFITIGVYIGNYDKGGHKVSLELDFYPEPEMPESKKYIQPLFNTVPLMEVEGQNYGKLFLTDTLKMNFEIPDSLENLQLLYTTTGHGGWGNGDEFNPKLNEIFMDGKPLFAITPWRTDCATYRLHNPSSGNFPDGLSSSDLSRSNWCPGTLTPPFIIPINKISKGKHVLQVAINQGKNEGTNFSHWCVTGVLVGNKK
ncbi:MAG: hypothetical protein RIQ33_1638, partial [Bacteroidota bacterium]